jgi:hypothetical protein
MSLNNITLISAKELLLGWNFKDSEVTHSDPKRSSKYILSDVFSA